MKTYQRQGFTLSWALLALVCLHEMVDCQPQVYFKASSPGKSLPRIGRRSDLDFPGSNTNVDDMWNELYTVNNYRPRPESVLLWRKIMGEQSGNGNNYNNYPEDSPQPNLSQSLYNKYKERK